MHWLLKLLIIIGIIVLIVFGINIFQKTSGEITKQTREEYCRQTRIDCYAQCNTRLIDYFCNKECDENYKVCLG